MKTTRTSFTWFKMSLDHVISVTFAHTLRFCSFRLKFTELNWIEWIWIELNWMELNWSELKLKRTETEMNWNWNELKKLFYNINNNYMMVFIITIKKYIIFVIFLTLFLPTLVWFNFFWSFWESFERRVDFGLTLVWLNLFFIF